MYSVALTSDDIKQLQQNCRELLDSGHCGRPLTKNGPPTPVPASTKMKPVNGLAEFPYLKSIIYNSTDVESRQIICVGMFLDEYTLLTSSACFKGRSSDPTLYLAACPVEHESHELQAEIIISKEDDQVALLRTRNPFNYQDRDLNEMCMYSGFIDEVIAWNKPAFFYGLFKDKILHYVSGSILPDMDCEELLDDFKRGQEFCFNSSSMDYSPCYALEGAPLLVEVSTESRIPYLIQIGIYKQNREKCDPSKPARFISVLPFNGWIERSISCILSPNDFDVQLPTRRSDICPRGLPEESHWRAQVIIIAIVACSVAVTAILGLGSACYMKMAWKRQMQLRKSLLYKQAMHDRKSGYINLFGNFLSVLVENIEIKKDDLELIGVIDHGQFGQIQKALMKRDDLQEFVAVKNIRPDIGQDLWTLVEEAYIMKQFDHENVLQLTGIAILSDQPHLVVPFMENGNLRNYLRDQASRKNYIFSAEKCLEYCNQICTGMAYLSSKNCLHRDLACRNVLVAKELTLKISDFGLSRKLPEDNNYYRSDQRCPIPVRWHPPESLARRVFVLKSDVWSFGVVMWEIFSMCKFEPYHGLQNMEVVVNVCNGILLEKPLNCPFDIFQECMLPCWSPNHKERPSFSELKCSIQQKQCNFVIVNQSEIL